MKMLVRSNVVVPAAERDQLAMQVVVVSDADAVELLFERAKEPLDPSVLPRTMQIDTLVPDAKQRQPGAHHPRDEAGFVVCSEHLGDPVLAEGHGEFMQDGQRGFFLHLHQSQTGTGAVVEQAKDDALPPGQIGLAGQVQRPGAVLRHRPGNAMP